MSRESLMKPLSNEMKEKYKEQLPELNSIKDTLELIEEKFDVPINCEWKVVANTDDRYYVANLIGNSVGLVYDKNSNKLLLPRFCHSYYCVNVKYGDSIKSIYIHNLVANAFLEKKNPNYVIDHMDENHSNNNVWNLKFVTRGENIKRAWTNHPDRYSVYTLKERREFIKDFLLNNSRKFNGNLTDQECLYSLEEKIGYVNFTTLRNYKKEVAAEHPECVTVKGSNRKPRGNSTMSDNVIIAIKLLLKNNVHYKTVAEMLNLPVERVYTIAAGRTYSYIDIPDNACFDISKLDIIIANN